VIAVSMVVYWMMIFWLKQSDTCVNGGLYSINHLWHMYHFLLIKASSFNKPPLTQVSSMVVYWMMILWLKQSDTWKLKQSDTCVNGGLLNNDTLIKTKWYLEIKTVSSFNKPPLKQESLCFIFQVSLCFNQNIII
jgi:hypothetical protein